MKESSFVVVNTPGQCRWCKCTEDTPCENGCSWANAQYTLCSECVALDKAMQTTRGRRLLSEFVQSATSDLFAGASFSDYLAENRGMGLRPPKSTAPRAGSRAKGRSAVAQ